MAHLFQSFPTQILSHRIMQIFERSILRVEGLARLLVLEKMATLDDRTGYLERRRSLRARPQTVHRAISRRRRQKRIRRDLKADGEVAEMEMNNYDTVAFHIPYGYEWDAKKVDMSISALFRILTSLLQIENLIYQTDIGAWGHGFSH
jgi:hypothetical protein